MNWWISAIYMPSFLSFLDKIFEESPFLNIDKNIAKNTIIDASSMVKSGYIGAPHCLGIGEEGMLSPGLLGFLGALGPGHQAPEGIFLEGVQDEGAEAHLVNAGNAGFFMVF